MSDNVSYELLSKIYSPTDGLNAAFPFIADINGDYLYVLDNTTLTVFDISDSEKYPKYIGEKLIGSSLNSSSRKDMEFDGNYLYLSVYSDDAIYVLDISDLEDISIIETVSIPGPSGIEKSGNYLYVCSYGSNTFRVYNASDPTNVYYETALSGTGSPNYLDGISDVKISGNYAFICSAIDDRLVSIDISSPTSLSKSGDIAISDSARKLDISGNYAFVGCIGSIRSFNISVPATMSSSDIISSGSDFGNISDVKISGNYIYVAANYLTILDISDPTNMSISDTNSVRYYALAPATNYLYSCTSLLNEIRIFNISDPSNITLANTLSDGEAVNNFEQLNYIVYNNNYLYGISDNNDYLFIIDVSDGNSPYIVGVYKPSTLSSNLKYFDISGNYLYLCNYGNDSLDVIDISDKTNPFFVASISGSGSPNYLNGAWNVKINGNYAYVLSYLDERLVVFDISTPSSPIFVTSFSFTDPYFDLDVNGNYLYVMSNFVTISNLVYDVSTPSNPIYKSSFSGESRNFAIDGNYLYFGYDYNFQSFDISNPSSIVSGDSLSTGITYLENISIFSTYAFFSINEAASSTSNGPGIHSVNIANPSSLENDNSYLNFLETGDDANFIDNNSSTLYLASNQGLYIVEVNLDISYSSEISVSDTVDKEYSSDIVIPFEERYSADLYSIRQNIDVIYNSDGADISLSIDQRYYADIAMKNAQINNLPIKLTVGNSTKYFVIDGSKESEPSDVYWIKILEDKESEPSEVNTLNIAYKNNLPCSIYVYNPNPSGGFIIN